MINTIFFDLDGTLLPLDMQKFMEIYFYQMGLVFDDLIDPKVLVKNIWTATEVMVQSLDDQTNEVNFMRKFGELVGEDILPVYQQRFTKFYDEGFLKVKNSVFDVPFIKESVAVLKKKGYEMVIATNPLFPEKAIHHRIRWAGFQPEEFKYITSYERNHFCKPQLNFYTELLEATGKVPTECLMVGNDVQEDMIASQLGLETYLITDHLIHRSQEPFQSTHQGTYEDFLNFVKALPSVG